MKIPAQEILQHSSYPLEPIVALEIKKEYESKIKVAVHGIALLPGTLSRISDVTLNIQDVDVNWFGNYE